MKNVAKTLAALGVAALTAGVAQAQQIETSVVSGDGLTSGSTLVVQVVMTGNAADAPQGASFRLRWHGSQDPGGSHAYDIDVDTLAPAPYPVVFTEQDMGGGVAEAPDAQDATQAAGEPMTYRDISMLGPSTFPATIQNPIICQVSFTVRADANAMANPRIIVEADPDATSPFPFFTLAPPSSSSLTPSGFVSTATGFNPVGDWMLLDQ